MTLLRAGSRRRELTVEALGVSPLEICHRRLHMIQLLELRVD